MDARSAAACRCWCVAWVHPCISAGDGDCTSTTRDPLHSSTRCASAGALWGLAPLPRGGGGGGGGGAGEAITACTPPPPPKPPPAPGRGFLHPSQRPALRHDGRRCARAPGCQPPSRALGRAAPALPPQRPRAVGGGGRGGWGGALGAGDPPCLRGSVKTAATGATARPVAASAPPIGAQWSPHGADANFTGGVCIHRRWTVRVARILKHFTNETSDFYISNSHDSGSELFVTGRFRRLVDLHPGLLRRLSDLSYQTGLT